jgi:hypothetical protein
VAAAARPGSDRGAPAASAPLRCLALALHGLDAAIAGVVTVPGVADVR